MSSSAGGGRVHTFLVLVEPGVAKRLIVWDTADISVGRAPENDIHADHGELSRRHALLTRSDSAWLVKNLSTSNGTLVNGAEVDSHALQPGDVVQMAEIRLEFQQGTRNPASLGIKLEYSSQLKDFGPAGGANPESTVLGLLDPVADGGDDEDFEVRPASDFAYDLHGLDELGPSPAARDLDADITAVSEDDLELPEKEQSWSLDDAPAVTQPASRRLSLHLEIEGLGPELRRRLELLLGKTIELPALKIRVKGDDVG